MGTTRLVNFASLRRSWGLLLSTLVVAQLACTTPSEVATDKRLERPATRPGPSEQLAELSDDYWETQMQRWPRWATYTGDRRFDDRLEDPSEEAILAHTKKLEALSRRLDAIDRRPLSDREKITAEVLEHVLGNALRNRVCRSWLWQVDQLGGFHISLAELPNSHTIESERDAANLLARYRQIGPYADKVIANLEKGANEGLVAPKINVERVVRQLDEMLAVEPARSPFVTQVIAGLEKRSVDPKTVVPDGAPNLETQLVELVQTVIHPALERYRATLKSTIAPRARTDVGVTALKLGSACYAARVESTLTVPRDPDDIHQLGLDEVKRIRSEMEALAKETGEKDAATWLTRLGNTKSFKTADELLAYNRELVARAESKMPEAFGRLPKESCQVKAIESFRHKDAPAAYYYSASDDGSRPAYYYVNTYDPPSRARYVMAALAFHEAVPGHHLQIALAGENSELPKFQREVGLTVFVEGWALYAERLSGELGLYLTPEEKLGALSYEMWRAVRLVVDTGLHTRGWSRDKAIDYLVEQTGKDRGEAENEIDRYIVWPGQALAYKVGQLEILRLRERARAELGDKFALAAFHDEILRYGAVPITSLQRIVERFIADQR